MDRLSLLFGDSFNQIKTLPMRHPTLSDIKEYSKGENASLKYMIAVNVMTNLLDLEPVAHILLVKYKIWYQDVDPWLYFIELYKKDNELRKIFKWWTGKEFGIIFSKNEPPYLYDTDDDIILNKPIVLMIINFIKEINCIPLIDKSRPNFGKRQRSAKSYYKSKYNRLKRKKTHFDEVDLASVISSVACKMQCNPTDLLEYHIYQIWERFYRIIQIDKYDKVMLGYYTGNIKQKDINFSSINWSKIIILDNKESPESGKATFSV